MCARAGDADRAAAVMRCLLVLISRRAISLGCISQARTRSRSAISRTTYLLNVSSLIGISQAIRSLASLNRRFRHPLSPRVVVALFVASFHRFGQLLISSCRSLWSTGMGISPQRRSGHDSRRSLSRLKSIWDGRRWQIPSRLVCAVNGPSLASRSLYQGLGHGHHLHRVMRKWICSWNTTCGPCTI